MDNRVVMISGANRGIGRSLTERLYEDGYRLSLGARDISTLEWTNSYQTNRILTCHYDATQNKSAQNWVEKTIKNFGQLDILINNAGILRYVSLEEGSEDDLDDLLNINVKAPFLLSRAAFPHLKKSGRGRVINVASMSGKRVKGDGAGYAMSKFAVVALSHATRQSGWDDGIRATALCPSWVNTDMAGHANVKPEDMTQPEDLGELVSTLLKLPNSASVSELWVNCLNDHVH